MANVVSEIQYGLGLLSSFGARVDVVGIYANGAGNSGAANIFGSSNIINSILGLASTTQSFGQLFTAARPVDARVRETSKVMQHPVESGATISDFHIINPVEIEMVLIVDSQDYDSTYAQMRQAFTNATPLSVKTRTGVYSDMIIAAMPHEEKADMYDVITIGLHLQQVLQFIPGTDQIQSNYQPINPLDSDTVTSGLQAAVALGSRILNTATGLASYAALRGRF